MVKVHEFNVEATLLDKVATSHLFITNRERVETNDFVFLKTNERSLMLRVINLYFDDGMQEGYLILKLKEVN